MYLRPKFDNEGFVRLQCHRGGTRVPPWWNWSAIVVELEFHRGGTKRLFWLNILKYIGTREKYVWLFEKLFLTLHQILI